jgi:hypothetical protein
LEGNYSYRETKNTYLFSVCWEKEIKVFKIIIVGQRMGGAVPPLPQYAFMAWCSARGSTGTNLPLPFIVDRGH